MDLGFEQLSKDDITVQVLTAIKDLEKQVLNALMLAALNPDQKDTHQGKARELRAAIARLRGEFAEHMPSQDHTKPKE